MVPEAPGTEFTFTAILVPEEVHALADLTVMEPLLPPKLTLIAFVPCPLLITAPEGTDQMYELAPVTVATL